jgi:transposase-like protein
MTYKNPYRKKTRFEATKTRQIIRYFCEDITATHTSKLLWIRRPTINDWYEYFRKAILRESIKTDKEIREWIIEVDESYFWPRRIRWKRWRWAWGKTKVLGVLKREGKVYVQIVPDCSAKSLIPIIRGKIDPEKSIVNTDWWRSYDGLIDMWYEKHYRVHHGKNEFARWKKHINWIESFRSFTKRRLSKFNWVPRDKFLLHLKECEYRFNCRLEWENMYNQVLKLLRRYSKAF